MSLKILNTAAAVEQSDHFNEARLLILLLVTTVREGRQIPFESAIKLAKMDFLLRYPNVLDRALRAQPKSDTRARAAAEEIPDKDKNTIEARMIRFRFGPYDMRYPRWLSVLAAKALILMYSHRNTLKIELTTKGKLLAEQLAMTEDFKPLAKRAEAVRLAVGHIPGTQLAEFIYQIVPELKGMKWGAPINL